MADLSLEQEAELASDRMNSNAYDLGCANTRSLFEHEYKQKVSNLHLGYIVAIVMLLITGVCVAGFNSIVRAQHGSVVHRCAKLCEPYILESCGDATATCKTVEGFITRTKQ